MNREKNFVEKIELELLSTLFRYVIPFIDNKINARNKKQESKLENIVNNQPRMDFKDINDLEKLMRKNLADNVKVAKNAVLNSNNLFYSLDLRRNKSKDEKANNYSITIKYEENSDEEKLKLAVKKDEKGVYSSEVINKKENPDKVLPYSILITYEDNYAEERLTITYRKHLRNYVQKHIENKEDMTNRVPLKWLNILPENVMGGVLGFTYLGENFMARRADLTGKTARMVDIHESIHTPDEYETRVLTSWIMEKSRGKYIR